MSNPVPEGSPRKGRGIDMRLHAMAAALTFFFLLVGFVGYGLGRQSTGREGPRTAPAATGVAPAGVASAPFGFAVTPAQPRSHEAREHHGRHGHHEERDDD